MVSKRTQPSKRTAPTTRSKITTTRSGARLTSTRVGDLGAAVSSFTSSRSKDKTASSKDSPQTIKRTFTQRSKVSAQAAKRVSARAAGKSTVGAAQRAAGNYRKYLMAIAAGVALVVAVIIGYVALYNSNAFEIDEVSVKGVDHLTATDLQNLAGVDQGTTLLNVDAEQICDQLKLDAWVQDVKVNRIFPHTLEIVVTERTITAVVKVPSADGSTTVDWAIASDGMWLMPIPVQDSDAGKLVNPQVYEDAANVLVISDVPYTTKPEIGSYCTDANVNNALDIVSGMTTELADRVTAVKATETESTTLTIKDGPDIVFGTADDIREKERVCLEIMNAHPDGVSYINVRSVDRPTYRAL